MAIGGARRPPAGPQGRDASSGEASRSGLRGDRIYALTGISEPMPLGVLIVVHVPFGTYFQALPW